MNRFIITDLKKPENMKNCVGCFGCFVKTPGKCVIEDALQNQGEQFGHCEEVIIISRCKYGGYSGDAKIKIDRCLPYLHADFTIVDGEMHHALRYDNDPYVKVYFYGEDITDDEKETAKKLVKGNSRNWGFTKFEINFCKTAEEAVAMAGIKEADF